MVHSTISITTCFLAVGLTVFTVSCGARRCIVDRANVEVFSSLAQGDTTLSYRLAAMNSTEASQRAWGIVQAAEDGGAPFFWCASGSGGKGGVVAAALMGGRVVGFTNALTVEEDRQGGHYFVSLYGDGVERAFFAIVDRTAEGDLRATLPGFIPTDPPVAFACSRNEGELRVWMVQDVGLFGRQAGSGPGFEAVRAVQAFLRELRGRDDVQLDGVRWGAPRDL